MSFVSACTALARTDAINRKIIQEQMNKRSDLGHYVYLASNDLLSPTLKQELRQSGYLLIEKRKVTAICWKD